MQRSLSCSAMPSLIAEFLPSIAFSKFLSFK